jgi:hypothetical protein
MIQDATHTLPLTQADNPLLLGNSRADQRKQMIEKEFNDYFILAGRTFVKPADTDLMLPSVGLSAFADRPSGWRVGSCKIRRQPFPVWRCWRPSPLPQTEDPRSRAA